jgi:hypothetical protein
MRFILFALVFSTPALAFAQEVVPTVNMNLGSLQTTGNVGGLETTGNVGTLETTNNVGALPVEVPAPPPVIQRRVVVIETPQQIAEPQSIELTEPAPLPPSEQPTSNIGIGAPLVVPPPPEVLSPAITEPIPVPSGPVAPEPVPSGNVTSINPGLANVRSPLFQPNPAFATPPPPFGGNLPRH